MEIRNINDIKKIFERNKRTIFGAAVFAFERLGPEKFTENYHLISLYDSKETSLIEKNVPLFCLEREIKKRITPRNSTRLLLHKNTQNYISKFSRKSTPLFFIYKSSYKIERFAKKKGWTIALAPKKFGKKFLENKANFRRVLERIKVLSPPGVIVPLSFLKNRKLAEVAKEFGMPFVMQHPTKGGGKGNFFIKDSKSFSTAKQYLRRENPKEIIISKFIDGPSPSITGCVTRHGIISTRPQYQICDEPLLNKRKNRGGLFCGHDFSSAKDVSKDVLKQAKEAVERVGNYLKNMGYKGIFGLDFILDERKEKLYVVECNPRLLATFPVLSMVQFENGEIPIIAFHLLEYLNIPYQINLEKINSQMWQKKEGSQMFLHNPFEKRIKQKRDFEAGVYKKLRRKLEFLREGYEFSQLKANNEFLFTDGIPQKGEILKKYQRIRIIARRSVLGKNCKKLDKKTKNFLRLAIKHLKKSFL